MATTNTKEMMNLNIRPPAEGSQEEETTETPEEENQEKETGGEEKEEGSIEEQAQELYDEIMGDDPRLCKALYKLLEEKYGNEEKTTRKEKATEKASGEVKGPDEYDVKGMED